MIQCYVGRTIKIKWVNYDLTKTNCVSTNATKFMQEHCDGRTTCSFNIKKAEFLGSTSCSGDSNAFLLRYTCKVDAKPAAPNALNVLVRGQKELLVVWSNDASNKSDVQIKFIICYLGGTGYGACLIVSHFQSSPNETLSTLQPMTIYQVTLARYSCDGKTIGEPKRHRIVITRSAALKTSGEKSATSFQIQLGGLQGDDEYVQIVVSKLRTNATPTDHPGNYLEPQDVNTNHGKPYITAEIKSNYVTKNSLFTVGDGDIYVRSGTRNRRNIKFQNVKLEPETYYSVFQRTFKNRDLYYDSDWMDVIRTDKQPPSTMSWKKDDGSSQGPGAGADDDEKYLAGIIVLAILLVTSFVINAYFICRLISSKANPENKTKDSNNSKNIDDNPDEVKNDENYEQVENEQSTYTALKRPDKEESDYHLYTHLNEVQHDHVNQEETGI